MKISIFPKAKALPNSKEEKAKEAWYTSKPHKAEILEIRTHDDLIEALCSNAWSPSIFQDYRNQNGFISTDFMVLDIDDGMTIEESESMVHKLDIACLCLPSTSHTDEAHRFRLIFPLGKTITTKTSFEATMRKLAEAFPADPSCIGDTARFFFGAKMVAGFWYDSNLLIPIVPEKPKNTVLKRYESKEAVSVGESIEELVESLFGEKREKIPDNIAYWLEECPNGLSGVWHNTCNSAIFTLGLMNIDQDIVEEVFRTIAPEDLDQHDEYLLTRAWDDGNMARDEM